MSRLYTPEQLIYQLDVAMKRDPDSAPPDDGDYWQALAALQIALQIERLEATIRIAFLELRELAGQSGFQKIFGK